MLGVHFGHLHKPFPPRQPLALAIVKCYLIVIFFLRDGGREISAIPGTGITARSPGAELQEKPIFSQAVFMLQQDIRCYIDPHVIDLIVQRRVTARLITPPISFVFIFDTRLRVMNDFWPWFGLVKIV
ncbi:hypothetical protein RRG08_008704 [Elysia crispata]|uniref:Uncharacterized protein n=1 Tax=Elysia crispata TaxID=231223 RepID=A0AAE0XPQ4_9GAST|nr:hypothetical protein RRG08_008704 [Elysia crispata]